MSIVVDRNTTSVQEQLIALSQKVHPKSRHDRTARYVHDLCDDSLCSAWALDP